MVLTSIGKAALRQLFLRQLVNHALLYPTLYRQLGVGGHPVRDRLRMVVAARRGVIQAWDVDPREPWPDGRDRPQDQAVSV